MSFDPTAGLQQIDKTDLLPGDEVLWTWKGSQGLSWDFYVHAHLPKIEGSEWAQKKAREEIDMIVDRDRTFYLISRG